MKLPCSQKRPSSVLKKQMKAKEPIEKTVSNKVTSECEKIHHSCFQQLKKLDGHVQAMAGTKDNRQKKSKKQQNTNQQNT